LTSKRTATAEAWILFETLFGKWTTCISKSNLFPSIVCSD